MKKRFVLIFAMLMALILALGLFVACNPKEDDNKQDAGEYTVRFDLNGEGQDVSVTGKTGEDISAKIPTLQDKASYYFGGWYLNADLSGERVEPETAIGNKDVTYHAKWYVKYAFKAQVEQLDGSYVADEEFDLIGESVKGERSEVSVTESDFGGALPEGFMLRDGMYRIDLSKSGRDSECDMYIARRLVKVTYVTGVGEDIVGSYKYGAPLLARKDIDGVKNRMLLGWAESDGGDVKYAAGEALTAVGNVTLYAVWRIGYGDIFGGSDTIYVSEEDDSKVYLERYGLDELLEGTLAGSGFKFDLKDGLTLEGELAGDGFYYFRDTYERVFNDYNGSKDTVEFLPHGKARLKEGENTVNGSYKYLPEKGIYSFTPADGGEEVLFALVTKDSELCFRKVDKTEAGNYIMRYTTAQDRSTWWIFEFDGLGNVIQHFDPKSADYVYEGDTGTYVYDEALKAYHVVISEQEEYYLRLNEEEKGKTVSGHLLAGSFIYRDSVFGEYKPCLPDNRDIDRSKDADLILDGFGEGTYKGEKITYDYKYTSWIEEDVLNEEYAYMYYYWVYFDYQGEQVMLGLEESTYYGGYYVQMAGEPEQVLFAATSDINVVYGNEYYDYTGYLGLFYYKYGKDGPYVSLMAAYMTSISGIMVMTELDYGVISPTETDGTYRFESKNFYFGAERGHDFYFQYDNRGDVLTQMYLNEVTIDSDLKLDIFGHAIFTDKSGAQHDVPYIYDDGLYLSFLTFNKLPAGEPTRVYGVKFQEDEDGKETMTFTHLVGFHMVTDTKNKYAIAMLADGHAYIGIPLSKDTWYFAIYGTYQLTDSETKTYKFVVDEEKKKDITDFLTAQGDNILSMSKAYFDFEYIIVDEERGDCNIKTKGFNLRHGSDALTLNEDGEMTLTTGGVTYHTTTFSYLTSDILILQVISQSMEHDIFVKLTLDEKSGEITDFVVGGEEANVYYLVDDLEMQLPVPTRYFIFVGNGEVIMVYNYGEYSLIGQYEPTGKTFEWGGVTYTEYLCSFYVTDPDGTSDGETDGETDNTDGEAGEETDGEADEKPAQVPTIFYTIAVTDANLKLDTGVTRAAGMYLQKAYGDGDYEIVGGGSLKGDGYHYATYVDAAGETFEYVRMGYCIIDDKTLNLDEGKQFAYEVVDEPTDNLIIVIYDENGIGQRALFFDITEDGKLDVRDSFNGSFAEVKDNAPSEREYVLYLDGHGNAIVKDAESNEVARGAYRLAPELGEKILMFSPADEDGPVQAFAFWIYRMDGINCYVLYNGENKGLYVANDYSYLRTDGFGQGVYVDKYGNAQSGLCTYLTSSLVKFASYDTLEPIYFELDKQNGTFFVPTGDWLKSEHVLFRYQGSDTDIVIPDDVWEIREDAFFGISVTSIDFKNTKVIGAGLFAECDRLASVIAQNVETVGNYAFESCISLTSVELPKATYIGFGAFKNCDRLERVVLSAVQTISNYAFSHETSAPVTIFDLRNLENVANLAAGEDAFTSTIEGALTFSPINMKIVLASVDSLNQLLSSDKANEVMKHTAGLLVEDDPMEGATYVGFESKSVYKFDGGTLIRRVSGGSSIYAVYDAQGTLYLLDDNEFKKASETLSYQNVITIGGETLFITGATHTLTIAAGSELSGKVELTLEADTNAYFGGLKATVKVNDDNTLSQSFDAESGNIRVSVGEQDTKYYDIAILGKSECSVRSLGNMAKLYTADEEYEVTAFIKDGKMNDLLSVGYRTGTRVDPNDESKEYPTYTTPANKNITRNEDGSFDLRIMTYEDIGVNIHVVYVAPTEGQDVGSVEVTVRSWSIFEEKQYGSSNGSGTSCIFFDIDATTLEVNNLSDFKFTTKTGIFASPEAQNILTQERVSYVVDDDESGIVTKATTVYTITTDAGMTFTVTFVAQRNVETDYYYASVTVDKA